MEVSMGFLGHLIDHHLDIVSRYENKELQSSALAVIPTEFKTTLEGLRARMEGLELDGDPVEHIEDMFLAELVKWFKEEYFNWFVSPICHGCKTEMMLSESKSEKIRQYSLTYIEVYECVRCLYSTMFSRPSDPIKILKSRIGRCSEWAQCFTLICRSLGYRARLVYSNVRKAWIHIDPCEGIVNKPLFYEYIWSKELIYVFAFAVDNVQDVTWRYCSNHSMVLKRRNLDIQELMINMIRHKQNDLIRTLKINQQEINSIIAMELAEFLTEPQPAAGMLEELAVKNDMYYNKNFRYVWKPLKAEVDSKFMQILYSCPLDHYQQAPADCEVYHAGWCNQTYSSTNIKRMAERDLDISYLSRIDGTKDAEVVWKVDLSETNLFFDTIIIICPIYRLVCSSVIWEIRKEGFTEPELIAKNIDKLSTRQLANAKTIFIKMKITGGSSSSWQRTQVFRQSNNDISVKYGFKFVLKRGSYEITV